MDRTTVHRRRWQILTVLSLCLIIIGMDNLIIAMALPRIQVDLHAGTGDLQWSVDAYSVLFGGLLLLSGGLGDRYGRKLMLTAGLAGFLGFSLAAALSGSVGMLIGFRALMGVSAALIMPATLAIIKDVFPPEEQTKAVSIWTAAAGLGVPLGPLVGGLLLDHFWWGSIFLINVPVVGVALIAAVVLIPESRDERHPGLDVGGALLSVVGLVAVVYGLVEGPKDGWGQFQSFGVIVIGAVLLAAFVVWELRSSDPMLDISLFRNPRFGASSLAIVCVGFALFGSLFMLTQYFQFVRAYQPLSSGIRLLAVCALVVTAGAAPQLVQRIGLKVTVAVGLGFIAVGSYAMSTVKIDSDVTAMVSLGLVGVGMGLVMPVAADAILAASPAHRSGAGSAVTDTSMQVGGALGIAVLGSVLTTAYHNSLHNGLGALSAAQAEAVRSSVGNAAPVAAQLGDAGKSVLATANHAFVVGVSDATLISTVLAAVGMVVIAIVMPSRAIAPALPGQAAAEPSPAASVERDKV